MNFWTFLDRNLAFLVFFLLLPMLVVGVIAGPTIIRAFHTTPKCEQAD